MSGPEDRGDLALRWADEAAAEEAEVRAAVDGANVPVLLMVLYQATGDERWLRAPYLPSRGVGLGDHDSGGLPEATQAEIRSAAVKVIVSLQQGTPPAIQVPTPDTARRMLSVCVGEEVGPEYGPLISDEIRRRQGGSGSLPPETDAVPPAGFRAIIIGAGVSGIIAAQQLQQMGVQFSIIEKQERPGGNWWQNTYPGAGVDTPSHLYSFSFAGHDWAHHFELQPAIQDYFERVVRKLDISNHIRYDTEVLAAQYDETSQSWSVKLRSNGETEDVNADVLISASGVLNRPKMPDITNLGSLEALSFHSAEWPAGLDLAGKKVAVVGNGASAMQIVPAIVHTVGKLTVIQRSPQWVAPFEKFHQPINPELRKLIAMNPMYRAWYWAKLFWQFGDRVIDALRKDPEWPHPERSVNARNDAHRKLFTRYLNGKLEGRDDLREKCLPSYPPYGKRILLDNGWFDALTQEHTQLVDEAAVDVENGCLVTESGTKIDADIVIWATGFEASRFVSSFEVEGREGKRLREVWNDDDPRAYLGITVPEFPNFYMLGGPNSFPGSGSFMFFMEMQMRYITRVLERQFQMGAGAVEPLAEPTDEYNDLVDRVHAQTVWTHPGMSTYYRNSRGRVVFVMPFLNIEYWRMTQIPDFDAFRWMSHHRAEVK